MKTVLIVFGLIAMVVVSVYVYLAGPCIYNDWVVNSQMKQIRNITNFSLNNNQCHTTVTLTLTDNPVVHLADVKPESFNSSNSIFLLTEIGSVKPPKYSLEYGADLEQRKLLPFTISNVQDLVDKYDQIKTLLVNPATLLTYNQDETYDLKKTFVVQI